MMSTEVFNLSDVARSFATRMTGKPQSTEDMSVAVC